jgi:hypothetical protein
MEARQPICLGFAFAGGWGLCAAAQLASVLWADRFELYFI